MKQKIDIQTISPVEGLRIVEMDDSSVLVQMLAEDGQIHAIAVPNLDAIRTALEEADSDL